MQVIQRRASSAATKKRAKEPEDMSREQPNRTVPLWQIRKEREKGKVRKLKKGEEIAQSACNSIT